MDARDRCRLKRVRIEGFRSIRSSEIELGDITVIIGSNGAGKSNLISAFTLVQSILEHKMQLFVARNGVNSLLFKGPKVTDRISMEFFFSSNSYGFTLVPTDDGRLIFEEEYFGWKGDVHSAVMRGHSESGWERGTGNGIEHYVLPVLADLNWRVYHFHDTGRSSKVKQEHNISDNISLAQDAGNLAAFLLRLKICDPAVYRSIIETIRMVAPYFDDFVLRPQSNNDELIVLRWMQRGLDDIFNASQISDGTLRFICLTVLLLQPAHLQPATIIIDEPELGLHPFAIVRLAEMISEVSRRKQVVISTQSVELLDQFKPDDVVVADRQGDESVFRRLDSENLDAWLEQDYSLGELWKKNIIGGRP
jgi:predicted ATPase